MELVERGACTSRGFSETPVSLSIALPLLSFQLPPYFGLPGLPGLPAILKAQESRWPTGSLPAFTTDGMQPSAGALRLRAPEKTVRHQRAALASALGFPGPTETGSPSKCPDVGFLLKAPHTPSSGLWGFPSCHNPQGVMGPRFPRASPQPLQPHLCASCWDVDQQTRVGVPPYYRPLVTQGGP